MITKIGILGLLGATAVGVSTGTVANASSGSPSTAGSAVTAAAASPATPGKHLRIAGLRRLLLRTEHGQLVTTGKDGTTVTHDLIQGAVTSVSATSITVMAADKTSETYMVNSATKVRMRVTRSAGSIGSVHTGDHVFVLGTGTSTLTATRVIDLG